MGLRADLSPVERRLQITAICFSSLSIVAAAVVALQVFRARSRGARVGAILVLVGWMSLADILWASKFIASYLTPLKRGPTCTFLGALGNFTALVTTSINFVIAVDVFLQARDPFGHRSDRWLRRYLRFAGGVATSTTVAFLAAGALGPATDGTCWVDVQGTRAGLACEVVFWCILFSYILFCLFVLARFAAERYRCAHGILGGGSARATLMPPGGGSGGVGSGGGSRRRASNSGSGGGSGNRAILHRMAFFTFAFTLLWVPESILYLGSQISPGSPLVDVLGKLQTLTIPLTGTINWLVWRKPLRSLEAKQGQVARGRARAAAGAALCCMLGRFCEGGGAAAAAATAGGGDDDDDDHGGIEVGVGVGGSNPGHSDSVTAVPSG
eukprot:g5460.t1